ncbi:MAG: ribbon-helix-helix domain-containing protein [Selenomonadaceae bacterium]|nr:ribbon-helix-helix domain-containing protein [Selenomonadaceae bacterium]
MATVKKQVLVRMNPCNYEKLKAVSEKNKRSLSKQIEYMVEQYIAKYENKFEKIESRINNLSIQ